LESIYFIQKLTLWSRLTLDSILADGETFNAAIPLFCTPQTFERVIDDPRPIDADLAKVFISGDPRTAPFLWREVEREFGVVYGDGRRPEIQFLVSCSPDLLCVEIGGREGVDRVLEGEGEMWRRMAKDGGGKRDALLYGGDGTVEVPEDTVLPVVGCWLLPATAFGALPEGTWEQIEWEKKMVVDLSKQRPRLAVLDIPL
jgi:hypothetical protein